MLMVCCFVLSFVRQQGGSAASHHSLCLQSKAVLVTQPGVSRFLSQLPHTKAEKQVIFFLTIAPT